MKTLANLINERKIKENERLLNLKKIYDDPAMDALTKNAIYKRVKFCQRVLNNLEETVKIEIAKHANLLFEGIRESLGFDEFKKLYYLDFEKYIYRMCSMKIINHKFIVDRQFGYNLDIQKAIIFFDLSIDDLKLIINQEIDDNKREEFMCFINEKYETKIPTLNELRKANEYYQYSHKNSLSEIECAKNRAILQVRNGVYIQTEYPLYYEDEIIDHYDKLKEDCEKKLKK